MNKISSHNIPQNIKNSNYLNVDSKKENSVQKAAIQQLSPKKEPMAWTKFAAIAVGSAAIAFIAAKTFQHFTIQRPDPAGGQTPPTPQKNDPEVIKQIRSLLDAAHLEKNVFSRDPDYNKVIESYLKAAELGSLEGDTYLREMLDLNYEIPGIQDQQAFKCEWRKKAVDRGLGLAELAYGWQLSLPTENSDVPNNLRQSCPLTKEGLSWMEKKAEDGNRIEQLHLSQLYANGKTSNSFSLKPDLAKALYYAKLAGLNDSDAMYITGLAYYNGKGVAKDSKLAFEYFEKSAEMGNLDAIILLGKNYSEGYKDGDFEIPVSLPKAIEIYSRGASQGNRYCQNQLITMQMKLYLQIRMEERD